MKNAPSTELHSITSTVFLNQLFQQSGNYLLPQTTSIISNILKQDLHQQGYEFLLQLKYLSPQAEINFQKLLMNDQFKKQLFDICRLLHVPESWIHDVEANKLAIHRFFQKIHRFIGHVAYSFFSQGMSPPVEGPATHETYPDFYAAIYQLEYNRLQKYPLGRFTVVKSGGIAFKDNQHHIITKEQYNSAQASSVHPASLGYGQDPYDPTGKRMGTGGKYRLDALQMLLRPTNQPIIITTGSFATPEEEKMSKPVEGAQITESYAATYGNQLTKNLKKHHRNIPQILYANQPTSHNTFAEIVNRLKIIYDQIHTNTPEKEKITLSVISNTYHLSRLQTMIQIILHNHSTPTDKKAQKYIQDLGGPRNAMFANCKATKGIDLQGILSDEQYTYLAKHLTITLIPAEEVLAATNFHVSYHPESGQSLTVRGYQHKDYQEMVAQEKKGEEQLQNCTYRMPSNLKQQYNIS